MRGFNLLQCVLLAFTLLSVHSEFTKAQAFPSTAPPHSTMHSTTPDPSSAPLQSVPNLCALCTCTGRISNLRVDCSRRGLTAVPADELKELANVGRNVTYIDLSSNQISLVRVEDFYSQGVSLHTIDLHDNRISEIDDEAFTSDRLKKLFVLYLGNNQLKSIPDNALMNLYLDILDLRENRLTAVPRALGYTKTISNLHLQGNPIKKLAPDFLDGIRFVKLLDMSMCGLSAFDACSYNYTFFSDLKQLYLDQNHITTIKNNHFSCGSSTGAPRLAFLTLLSIQSSGVREIEDFAFDELVQLKQLHLSGNNLGIFRGRVFSNLQNVNELDISHCNITDLKRVVFKQLAKLENLYLDHNNIEVIHHRDFSFLENSEVRVINLADSNIQRIDGQPFENLTHLGILDLNNNAIDDKSLNSFGAKGNFYRLLLSNNTLEHIPNLPSSGFPHLRELDLSDNLIYEIRQQDLQDMALLDTLLLRNNKIRSIEDNAFKDAVKLTTLDLDGLQMTHLPTLHLPRLYLLHIKNGNLESLPENMCELSPYLQMVEAENNRITRLPSFNGCKLMSLAFANNQLTSLEYHTFENQHELRLLIFDDNEISNISEGCFRDTGNLEYLHLKNNLLTSLPKDIFANASLLVHVDLSYNQLRQVDNNLFAGNSEYLSILDLSFNELERFDTNVLPESSQINKLDLSSNNLNELEFPMSGLLWLTEFFVTDNANLFQVPDVVAYPNVTDIKYTYAYHCCIWNEVNRNPHTFVDHSDENNTAPPTVIPTPEPLIHNGREDECIGGEHTTAAMERWELLSETFNITVVFLPNCQVEIIIPEHQLRRDVPPTFAPSGNRPGVLFGPSLNCSPTPDDLSPCGNLIDPWALRAFVWFLWIVALLGNGAVLFISIATKDKLEVYQFLICCLAFADFCMGVYLAFLAAVDIRTFGQISFYQSALYWQNGPGCKAAGFIAVFASELSVIILVLLTLERVYTLTFTFKKNEPTKMKVASLAAIIAVLFSAMLAALPLVGINSYSQVSVCLPYVTEAWTDKMYIGTLLSIHLVGFLIIMFSYVYIFRNIYKSPAAHQKKKEILLAAGKIAILIATAFVCWIPIVVIGYLALGDIKAVNPYQAKFLIILIYPLNACVNPFIYAIFTRQFRQKVSVMLRRSNDRVSSLPSRRTQLQRGSSAFLPANSPRNRTPMELVSMRQGRRSNSLCVHLAMSNPSTPPVRSPPSLSPPPGVYMGRRASLPFSFGSSLRTHPVAQANSHGGSVASNNSTNNISGIRQLNLLLGCGQAAPSNPGDDAREEPTVNVLPTSNLNNSLGGSQDSSNRQLPGIPEEQEDENQSVCSADFHDAQEDVIELEETETKSEQMQPSEDPVCDDAPCSDTPSPPKQKQQAEEELRESIDSAYSGDCSSVTPDVVVTGPQSSPAHSCLSRRSESFSSYDLAVSECSDAHDTSPSTPLPTPIAKDTVVSCSNHQSDLDTVVKYCKNSSSHESIDEIDLSSAELETVLHSTSNTQLSAVGSETSI